MHGCCQILWIRFSNKLNWHCILSVLVTIRVLKQTELKLCCPVSEKNVKEFGIVGCQLGDDVGESLIKFMTRSRKFKMICVKDNLFSPQMSSQIALAGKKLAGCVTIVWSFSYRNWFRVAQQFAIFSLHYEHHSSSHVVSNNSPLLLNQLWILLGQPLPIWLESWRCC